MQRPLTNHSLIQILGKSQRSRQWRAFRKEVRELPNVIGHGPGRAIFYEFANNGVHVAFTREGRVFDVSLYGPAAMHYSEALGSVQLYQLELPGGLALEDKKADIVPKLGESTMSEKRKPPMVEKNLPHKEAMRQIRSQKETIENELFVVDGVSIRCSFDSLQHGQLLSITFRNLDDRQRADICMASGQHREAIALFEKCMREKPDDFLLMTELAECHWKLEEFGQAEKYFQTAISSPLLKEVVVVPFHLSYANLLERLGRFEDACKQLLIVYREQERREDKQKEITMVRLKNLASQAGLTIEKVGSKKTTLKLAKVRKEQPG